MRYSVTPSIRAACVRSRRSAIGPGFWRRTTFVSTDEIFTDQVTHTDGASCYRSQRVLTCGRCKPPPKFG
jgi:hypothetical protein